jgi:hypothetical protein
MPFWNTFHQVCSKYKVWRANRYLVCIYCVYMPLWHQLMNRKPVFNFRKLLSTLPNYAELEQILLFSVNWGKQVWYRSYSTERDIPWSITVIVIMSRRVMWIKILNSCRWSGGNKTPGVNLVITRFHKILMITLRHINVLHEEILIHITLLDMITITVIDHGMSLSVLYDLTHWATQAPIFSRYM